MFHMPPDQMDQPGAAGEGRAAARHTRRESTQTYGHIVILIDLSDYS